MIISDILPKISDTVIVLKFCHPLKYTLKKLFPGLLNNSTKILNALKVENINPNKLLQLPMPEQMSNNGLIK